MTDVKVTLEFGGRNRALLVVEDDEPEGSVNLAHAFTFFTDSANNSCQFDRWRSRVISCVIGTISLSSRRRVGGVVTAKTQYSLANAQSYFAEHLAVGDYYREGQRVGGEWFANGAGSLDLNGKVQEAEFRALCENQNPRTG